MLDDGAIGIEADSLADIAIDRLSREAWSNARTRKVAIEVDDVLFALEESEIAGKAIAIGRVELAPPGPRSIYSRYPIESNWALRDGAVARRDSLRSVFDLCLRGLRGDPKAA